MERRDRVVVIDEFLLFEEAVPGGEEDRLRGEAWRRVEGRFRLGVVRVGEVNDGGLMLDGRARLGTIDLREVRAGGRLGGRLRVHLAGVVDGGELGGGDFGGFELTRFKGVAELRRDGVEVRRVGFMGFQASFKGVCVLGGLGGEGFGGWGLNDSGLRLGEAGGFENRGGLAELAGWYGVEAEGGRGLRRLKVGNRGRLGDRRERLGSGFHFGSRGLRQGLYRGFRGSHRFRVGGRGMVRGKGDRGLMRRDRLRAQLGLGGHGRRSDEGAVDGLEGVTGGEGGLPGLSGQGFRLLLKVLGWGGSKGFAVRSAVVAALAPEARVPTIAVAAASIAGATVVAAGNIPGGSGGGIAAAKSFSGENGASIPGSGKGEVRDGAGRGLRGYRGCGGLRGFGGTGAVLGEGLARKDDGLDGCGELGLLAVRSLVSGTFYLVEIQ